MIPATYYLPLPPSVTDDRLAYAQSMSGFFIVCITSAAWLHRTCMGMIDRPRPLLHSNTLLRGIMMCLMISALLRNAPDLVLNMGWRWESPIWRYGVAHWNRVLDGWSGIPQIMAYLLFIASTQTIEWHADYHPMPPEFILARPNLVDMAKKGLMIVLCVTICFFTAYFE